MFVKIVLNYSQWLIDFNWLSLFIYKYKYEKYKKYFSIELFHNIIVGTYVYDLIQIFYFIILHLDVVWLM